MTFSQEGKPVDRRLRAAIVLTAGEENCVVVNSEGSLAIGYAMPFPRPRSGRIFPANLVAVGAAADGSEVIWWRWFDAVVVEQAGSTVTLWEPNHGIVVGRPRDPQRRYLPGGRAYASAGLPGAEWWVAGPTVDEAESADVELGEVEEFLTVHGWWGPSVDG